MKNARSHSPFLPPGKIHVRLCLCAILVLFCKLTFGQSEVVWQRVYGGPEDEQINALLPISGGWLAVGSTSAGAGNTDGLVMWISADGDSLSSMSFGGPYDDVFNDVATSTDSIYVMVGKFDIEYWNDRGIWLAAITLDGDLLWERSFAALHGGVALTVESTPNGNFLVAGSICATDEIPSCQGFLMLLNADGDSLDGRWYGGPETDRFYSIIPQTDGYLLSGWTWTLSRGDEFWIMKASLDFDSLWSRIYGTDSYDYLYGTVLRSDHTLLLGGRTNNGIENEPDGIVVCVNENGDSLWTHQYGQNLWESFYAVAPAPDNSCYLAGYECCYPGNYGFDSWLVRIDSVGSVLWELAVDADGAAEYAYAACQTEGGVIIAGSWQATSGDDPMQVFIAKVSDPYAVASSPSPLPSKFALHQNYPNPFNAVTEIQFDIPVTARVELSIFNTLGQKVATLMDEPRVAGTYRMQWDASSVASGVYLYQLKAGNFTDTKKMILLK